jgi:hypothetical protein
MAILTVNLIVPTAGTPQSQTLVAAAGGGDSFPNSGREYLAVKNAGAGSITLTIVASGGNPCNFGFPATPTHDLVYTIPNDSAVHIFGPFLPATYTDGNGRVQITYSGVSSVTIAPFTQQVRT